MSEIAPEKVKAFLEELTLLSRKHEIKIDACGCCSSPWLEEVPQCSTRFYEVDDNNNMLCFREPTGKKDETGS